MTIIERSVGDVGKSASGKLGFSRTHEGEGTSELRSERVHLRTKAEVGYRVKTLPMVACTECVHVHEHGEAPSTCDLVEGTVDGQHVCSLFALTESRVDQSVMHVRDWRTWDEDRGKSGGRVVANAHTPSNHIIPAEPNNAKTTNELKYITEGETAWEAHGAANLAEHDATEGHSGGNEPSPGAGHEGGGGGASVSSHSPSQHAEAQRAHEGMPKERSTKDMSETESSERHALSDRFDWEAKAVNAHEPEDPAEQHKPYVEGAEGNRLGRFVKGYRNARHDARDRNLSAEDARAASDAHRAIATMDPKTGKRVLANPPQAERRGAAMGYKAHALEQEGKGQPAEWAQHDWSTGHPGERRVESPFAKDSEEHQHFARGYHGAMNQARGANMDSEHAAARAVGAHHEAQLERPATEKAFHLGEAKGFEHHAENAPAPTHAAAPEGVDEEHFSQGRQEASRQVFSGKLLPEDSASRATEHAEKANATSGAESARHAGMAAGFKEHAERVPTEQDKIHHEAIRAGRGPGIAPEHVEHFNAGADKATRHVEEFNMPQEDASKRSEKQMKAALGEKDEAKRAAYLGQAAAYRSHAVHNDAGLHTEPRVIEPTVARDLKLTVSPDHETKSIADFKPSDLHTPLPEGVEEPKTVAELQAAAEVAPSSPKAPKAVPGGPNPVGTRWTHKTSNQFIVKMGNGSLRKFHEWGEPVRGTNGKIQDVPAEKGHAFEKALDTSDVFHKEEVEADEDVRPPERPVAPPEPAKVEQQVHQVAEPAPPKPEVAPPTTAVVPPKTQGVEHASTRTNARDLKPGDRIKFFDENANNNGEHREEVIKSVAPHPNPGARKGDVQLHFAGEESPWHQMVSGGMPMTKTGEGFPTDVEKAAPKVETPEVSAPEAPHPEAPHPEASAATASTPSERKIENPFPENAEHQSSFNHESSQTFRNTEGMLPVTAEAKAMEHEAKAANEVDEAQKVIHLGTAAGYLRRSKEERDWTTGAYRGPVSGHTIKGNTFDKGTKEHRTYRENFISARRHARHDELNEADAQNQVDHHTQVLNDMQTRKPNDIAKAQGKIEGYKAHIEQLNNPAPTEFTDAKVAATADIKPDKPIADLSAPYAKPEHVDLENSVLQSSLNHLSKGNVTPTELRSEARQDAEQAATTADRGYDGEPLRATANGKLKAADQYENGGGKPILKEGGTNKPATQSTMMARLQEGDRIWHNGEPQFVHSNVKEPGKMREMTTVSEKTGEMTTHTHSGNHWFEKLPATVQQPTLHGEAPRLEDAQLEAPTPAVQPVGHLHGSTDSEIGAAHDQGAADARDELENLNPSQEEAATHAAALRDEIKARPRTQAEEQDHSYKTGMAETYETHAATPRPIAATSAGEETPAAPKGDEAIPEAVQPGHEEAFRQGLQEGYAHGTDMHANQGKSAAQVKALASNTYFKQAKKAYDEGDFNGHAQKYGFARGLGRAASEKRAMDKVPTEHAVSTGLEEGPATDLGTNPTNNAEATISPSVVKAATPAPTTPPTSSNDSQMESAVSRATDEGLKYNDIRDSAGRAGASKSRAENENIVQHFNAEAQKALAKGDYSQAAWLDAHAKGYGQALGG